MASENQTKHPDLLLLGLARWPEHEHLFLALFFTLYLLNMLGNLLIILLICFNAQLLHAPMCFFLSHLSFMDISFTSTTIPKMLHNLYTGAKNITYASCLAQMYFFMAFVPTENFLLGAMALDCYMAICQPLHYPVVMSPTRCHIMVSIAWQLAPLHSLMHAVLMSQQSFCDQDIHHCFGDSQPLLVMACSEKHLNEMLNFFEGGIIIIGNFLLIPVSYALIVHAVLRVPSARGQGKAFQTCASHLIVVTFFSDTAIRVYFQSPSTYSGDKDKVATVMYTVVTSMLNFFIYSLRNTDMKAALHRSLAKLRNVLSKPGDVKIDWKEVVAIRTAKKEAMLGRASVSCSSKTTGTGPIHGEYSCQWLLAMMYI